MPKQNQNYAYINQLQEYAIQHPEWFWSDREDASKARQYLYNNGASTIVDTIYENTPDSIKKNIDSKKLSDNIKSKQFQQGITDAIDKAGHDYVLPAVIVLGGGLATEAGAASGVAQLLGKAGSKALQIVDNTITKPVSHVLEVTTNPTIAKTTIGSLAGTAALSSRITDSAALLADVYERGKKNPSSVNAAEYAMALLALTPGTDIPQGQKLNTFMNGLKSTPGAIETLIKDFNNNPKRAIVKYRTLWRDYWEPKQDNWQQWFRDWSSKKESKLNKLKIPSSYKGTLEVNQYESPNKTVTDYLNFKIDNLLGFNYNMLTSSTKKERHVFAKNNRRAHRWLQNSDMPVPEKTYFNTYKDVLTSKDAKKSQGATHTSGLTINAPNPFVQNAKVKSNNTGPVTIDLDLAFDDWRRPKHFQEVVYHENTHNIINRLGKDLQVSAWSPETSYFFPNYQYKGGFATGQQLTLWQPNDRWKKIEYVVDEDGNKKIKKLWENSPEEWVAEYNGARNVGATDEQMKTFFKKRFKFKDDDLSEVLDFAKNYSDKYIYKTTK